MASWQYKVRYFFQKPHDEFEIHVISTRNVSDETSIISFTRVPIEESYTVPPALRLADYMTSN